MIGIKKEASCTSKDFISLCPFSELTLVSVNCLLREKIEGNFSYYSFV